MKKTTLIKIAAVFTAVSALGVAALWSAPVVRRYTLKGPDGLRVLLLSDLHGYVFGKDQSELINLIRSKEPDIILLAGDIVDYQAGFEGTHLLLEGIRGLAPVFYVTGNHEYYEGKADHITLMLSEDYGVNVLSDDYIELEIKGHRLMIAGVEDPMKERIFSDYNQTDSMRAAFGGLDGEDGTYKILLTHRPERYKTYLQYPFDLIVSGHTHGGQVRLPLLINGLYAPNQGYFPKYAGGLYIHGQTNHIVTRGIGLWPRIPRVFNPPEICLIEFKEDK